jgi:phosphoglycerate dehydrogenase-like enzyme
MSTSETRRVTVLVPDELALEAFEPYPALRPVLYDLKQAPSPEQRAAEAIGIGLAWVDDVIPFLRQLPNVKLVQTLFAGYDDWVGQLPPGVALSNGRGAHGRAVAEWVAATLLAHYRDLAYFNAEQAKGIWSRQIKEGLDEKRVAVLGAGDLGVNAKRVLEPFGCRVTLVGRTAREGVLSLDQYRAIHGEQDVIVLLLPISEETAGIADAAFLAEMKDGAILMNAGRGPLVSTDALIAEASTGRIKAILDVTDPEPLPDGHPLFSTPGVTITPHIGGGTEGWLARGWKVAARQIDLYARLGRPENLVIEAS